MKDDDEEEEEEPLLKYQRLKGHFPNVLKRYKLTCFSVCPNSNRVAIGTEDGYAIVFDSSSGKEIERYSLNGSKICVISVVTDYVASCSDDGTWCVCFFLSHEFERETVFER